jgi:hypothetical protein
MKYRHNLYVQPFILCAKIMDKLTGTPWFPKIYYTLSKSLEKEADKFSIKHGGLNAAETSLIIDMGKHGIYSGGNTHPINMERYNSIIETKRAMAETIRA